MICRKSYIRSKGGQKKVINICKICGHTRYVFEKDKNRIFCYNCRFEKKLNGSIDKDGYKIIRININNIYSSMGTKIKTSKNKVFIKEHRYVMAKHLDRCLTRKEVVHHIDRDKLNNKIENLMLFASNSEHIKFHKLHNIPL